MKACDFDFDIEDVLGSAELNARNSWEEEFVEGLADKYAQWGDDMFISEKQIEILCRIAKVAPPDTSTLGLF